MEAGKLLKQAREEKKLTLHEIGMSLKINPKTLQAIEEGDTAKLPPKTFLRGFIKSYAQHLKLDPNLVLQADHSPGPIQPEPVSKADTHVQSSEAQKDESLEIKPRETKQDPLPSVATPLTPLNTLSSAATNVVPTDRTTKLDPLRASSPGPRKGVYFALIIGLLLTIGAIFGQVKKYQRDAVVTKPEVDHTVQPLTATPAQTSPQTAAETTLPSPAPSAAVGNEKPAIAAKEEPVSSSPIKVDEKAAPNLGAVTATPPNPSASNKPETTTGPTAKPQEVILEALNNVHITYSLTEGKVEQLDLQADEIHTFKSNSMIHLEISDGGSVNLILNGRDRGVPGKIGRPLVLNYPK